MNTRVPNSEKKTRANLKLASLNVKGRMSPNIGTSPISKWTAINRMMRDQKIGILCLQETHLNPENLTQIENLYTRRLTVLSSSDPRCPGSAVGVAFVLNNKITNSSNAKVQVLIPGRVIALSVKWHDNKLINILNIYAPNNPSEHKSFWKKVESKWSRLNTRTPDFIIGDFNLTEDLIDCAPARLDNDTAVDALRDLRTLLKLQDTWRLTYPTRRLFTFSSNLQSLSRLDRIYASEIHTESLLDWDSQICQVPTDHHMVTVRFAPPDLPHIRKGRWSWPAGLLMDNVLIKCTIELGMKMQNMLESPTPRSENNNPQRVWLSFKTDLNKIAKDTTKTHLCRINQRIRTLTKDLRKLTNTPEIDTSENMRLNEIIIEQEIKHLQRKKCKNTSLSVQVQWASHGETISKYWSRMNSQKTPRDVIHRLNIPGTTRYTDKSEEMAEIAKMYHDKIQTTDTQQNESDKTAARKQSLAEIPDEQKLATPNAQMSESLREEYVIEALMSSKSGSAAGINGIPYDVWKTLHQKHIEAKRKEKPSFDIIRTLTLVINDIQVHGVTNDSSFAVGWMCPLYKKKECYKIENYRPITLLNTDYKILTKLSQSKQHRSSIS